jgi:hypothetical protein
VADTPVAQKEISKSDAISAMRTALIEGQFDTAKQAERDALLAPHVVASVANSVYEHLSNERLFERAIELSGRYDLGHEKTLDAALSQFRLFVGKGDIEEALSWGLQWKLSNLEISRAALKGIEQCLMKGDIPQAVELKGRYNITIEQIGNIWMKGFDLAMKERRYFDAAMLSRDFGQSDRKTLLTASKALKDAVAKHEYDMMVKIEDEFHFFNDESFGLIGDEECKSISEVYQKFFMDRVAKRDTEHLLHFIDGSGVLYSEFNNGYLNALVQFVYKRAVEFHGVLLNDNLRDLARDLKEGLTLMDERVNIELRRRIMEQALKYHNRILLENNYDQAKAVKDEYDLLGITSPSDIITETHETARQYFSDRIRNGEIKKAQFILDEYGLPRAELTQQLVEDLRELLNQGKCKVAFEMMLEFKVPTGDSDLKEAATKAFDENVDQGYYEIAADLGHVFELKSPKVHEAAQIVWQRAMESEDYKKARLIKRKHHLGRKETVKIATTAYNANMERNKAEIARKLREEYHIQLGFMEMILEFLKSIFSFLFKE